MTLGTQAAFGTPQAEIRGSNTRISVSSPPPQPFPASGSFPVSQLFASGDQRIGASASALRAGGEKGQEGNEMDGWHHQHNGHAPEKTPGAGEGQGSLTCCRRWGLRVRHTQQLNSDHHPLQVSAALPQWPDPQEASVRLLGQMVRWRRAGKEAGGTDGSCLQAWLLGNGGSIGPVSHFNRNARKPVCGWVLIPTRSFTL